MYYEVFSTCYDHICTMHQQVDRVNADTYTMTKSYSLQMHAPNNKKWILIVESKRRYIYYDKELLTWDALQVWFNKYQTNDKNKHIYHTQSKLPKIWLRILLLSGNISCIPLTACIIIPFYPLFPFCKRLFQMEKAILCVVWSLALRHTLPSIHIHLSICENHRV